MASDEKKNKILKLRVTENDLVTLDQLADKLRVSRSELVRALIFEKDAVERQQKNNDDKDLLLAIQQLQEEFNKYNRANKGVANNINQIARRINQNEPLTKEIEDYLRNAVLVYTKNAAFFKRKVDDVWRLLKF